MTNPTAAILVIGDDFGMDVGDDARLAQGDADPGQFARQEMQVRIAGSA